MSGREKEVFSFDVELWIKDLLGSFRVQIQNQTTKLANQMEHQLLALNREKLAELEPDELNHAKSSLQKQVREIATSISSILLEALATQGEILSNYLQGYVFMVPPDAILAVSPLEVPIPASSNAMDVDSSATKDHRAHRQQKGASLEEASEPQKRDLKEVMLKIHKAEHFITRLKEVYTENEEYIQILQRTLHSLLQVEEAVKSNDTESATQRMFDTLHTSCTHLHALQGTLDKRGINANINIKQAPEPIV